MTAVVQLPRESLWHLAELMRDVDPLLGNVAAMCKPATLLDVGAHVGAFSLLALWRWPKLRIEAYEPHPELAKFCHRNLAQVSTAAVVHARAVLGACNHAGQSVVELCERGGSLLGSSVVNRRGLRRCHRVSVQRANELAPAEVVKIDAEWAEAGIVEDFPHWAGVRAAIIETHDDEQERRVRRKLEEVGLLRLRRVPGKETFELALWVQPRRWSAGRAANDNGQGAGGG